MRVLYIEDVFLNARVVEAYIKHIGDIDIDIAEDAESGLERLASEAYDLILMDINLPGIDGIEATRILRRSYTSEELPIIMVSANNEKETIHLSIDVGANGYITKPVDIDILRQELGKYM